MQTLSRTAASPSYADGGGAGESAESGFDEGVVGRCAARVHGARGIVARQHGRGRCDGPDGAEVTEERGRPARRVRWPPRKRRAGEFVNLSLGRPRASRRPLRGLLSMRPTAFLARTRVV